jgi:hypothetical protein
MFHQFLSIIADSAAGFSTSLFAPDPYLDPGSGSYILQILIATFVGGLFALRASWGKLGNFLRRRFNQNKDSTADEE